MYGLKVKGEIALKPVKKLLGFSLAIVVLLCCGTAAFAAEQNLPDAFLIGDNSGVHAQTNGSYFLYASDLKPGDVITRSLFIQNFEADGVYKLYLNVESAEEAGSAHFLDNLYLTLTLDGTVLYKGRLRGDGQGTPAYPGNGVDFAQDSLDLGQYSGGDSGSLVAEIRVDSSELDSADWAGRSTAKVEWSFTAIKATPKEGPKTGEILRYTMVLILLLLLFATIILRIWRKKLKDAERDEWENHFV